MASTVSSLSAELARVTRLVEATESRKNTTESQNRVKIAQDLKKYAQSVLCLADFVAKARESQIRDRLNVDDQVGQQKFLAQVNLVMKSLDTLVSSVNKQLDNNMQISLEMAEIYSRDVLGLERRIQQALEDLQTKITATEENLRNLRRDIERKKVMLQAAQEKAGLTKVKKETARVESLDATEKLLWGFGYTVIFGVGAVAAPILFVPATAALGVAYGYGFKAKSKLEEAERLTAELASLQSRINNDDNEIGTLERNASGLVQSRSSFDGLLFSAKSFTGRVEKCCAKLQTLERNYSKDQLKIADVVMQIRSTRLTTMNLDYADSREEVLRILRILCLELGDVAQQGQKNIQRDIHTRDTVETRNVLLRLAAKMDFLEAAQEADRVMAKAEAEAKEAKERADAKSRADAEAKAREEAKKEKERAESKVRAEALLLVLLLLLLVLILLFLLGSESAQVKEIGEAEESEEVEEMAKAKERSKAAIKTVTMAQIKVEVKSAYTMDLKVTKKVGTMSGGEQQVPSMVAKKVLEVNKEAKGGVREAHVEALNLEVKTRVGNDGPEHTPQLKEVEVQFETIKTDDVKPMTGALLRKAVGEMDKAASLKKDLSVTDNNTGKNLMGILIAMIAIPFLLDGIWNLFAFSIGLFANKVTIGETSTLQSLLSWHFILPLPSTSDPIWDGLLVILAALSVTFLALMPAATGLFILGVSVGGLYIVATKGGLFTWVTIIFAMGFNDALKEKKALARRVKVSSLVVTYFLFISVLIMWKMLRWILGRIF